MKRLGKYIILSAVLVFFSSKPSIAEIKNEKSIGLLLGDPIAASLKIPVSEKTFLNIHAGIWTWSFWHDINYDTPFLSVDYDLLNPLEQFPFLSYVGAGIAFFFADNPKDKDDYDACAAIRLPVGLEFYKKNNFSLGFEVAPIYQFLPVYNAKPYIIELNGGLVIRFFY
jgi:hypothetical protein